MPTPPTTLRALLIAVTCPEINGYHVTQRLSKALQTMFDTVDLTIRYQARDCTREGLMQTIEAWITDPPKGVPHLLFINTHGGRVRYRDLEPELGDHALNCLQASRDELLGHELSALLATLDRRCGGNVCAILDACHSATVFRAGAIVREQAPDYVRESLAAPDALAAESHPRIVRLSSSSPVRESFGEQLRIDGEDAGGVGYFTTALLEVLEDAGDRWPALSWEMLAHAVRERVIWELSEHQWLSLAGPGGRLLFDRRPAPSPRLVGCMDYRGSYWIRAGALTGVHEGDRWRVVAPFVDGEGQLVSIASGLACDVESSRSPLDVPVARCLDTLRPVAAVLERVREPLPVAVEPALADALKLDDSIWLSAATPADQRVALVGEQLELVDDRDTWETLHVPRETGRAVLIDILEDRARARRITSLQHVAATSPTPTPIEWTVGATDPQGAALPLDEPLPPGAALSIRLRNTAKPTPADDTWFASVILIDVLGRPWLLNASVLDGVELEAGGSECIGQRLGGVRSGIVLGWPPELPSPTRTRSFELVLLSSQRPLQLGHLTRALPLSEGAAFRMQGLEVEDDNPYRSARRAPDKKMAASAGWGWASMSLRLAP